VYPNRAESAQRLNPHDEQVIPTLKNRGDSLNREQASNQIGEGLKMTEFSEAEE
jgi:hypothetical protein